MLLHMICSSRHAKVLVCVLALTLVSYARAALTPLTDGATISSDDIKLYKVSSGSVAVKLSGTASDGVFTLKAGFSIDTGASVSFDTSEVVGQVAIIRMTGSLRGTGKLSFGTGIAALKFGEESVNRTNIIHLPAFEGDVVFAEAGAKVVFFGGVSVLNWPTCLYEIADGAVLGLVGKDLFTSDFTLSNFDIDLVSANCIFDGVTVTVPTGRTLYHRSGTINTVSDSSTSLSQWAGGTKFKNNINVILSGGEIQFQDRTQDNYICGAITGDGNVISLTAGGSCGIEGKVDFAGEIRQSDTSTLNGLLDFKLKAGSTLTDVDCFVTGEHGGRIRFDSDEPLTVKSASSSHGGTISLTSGTVLTMEAVSGGLNFDGVGGAGGEAVLPNVGTANVTATSDVVLTLTGKQVSYGFVDAVHVAIAADADITCALGGSLRTIDNRGGQITEIPSWHGKVALWTDASDVSSFVGAIEHVSAIGGSTTGFDAAQVFEWKDVRKSNRNFAFRVSKYDASTKDLTAKLFPFLKTDPAFVQFAQNDKTRMQIALPEYGTGDTTIASKCVVVVCRADEVCGGGFAMFSEASGRLARKSTISSPFPAYTDPICLDGSVSVRTNGIAVTGGEVGFSGGWQIVTLTSDTALQLRGISHPRLRDNANFNGGQQYAEILIFNVEPTDEEIVEVEDYLARKWNQLTAVRPAALSRTLQVCGSGSATLLGDITMDAASYYTGTLRSKDGCVTFPDASVPWTESEVPSRGRLLWADASLAGAVRLSADPNKPDEVDFIYTRDNAGLVTSNGAYYLTSPYDPAGSSTYLNCNRRVRFSDGWLKFAGGYADETWGNLLVIRKLPSETMTAWSDPAETIDGVRGGFVALDSLLDGGSPMISAQSGSQNELRFRTVAIARERIWNLASDFTASIATWLDGRSVGDGLTTPFGGHKETMSFNVLESKVRVKCFGYADPVNQNVANREVMGEWLLYDRNLGDCERAGVESYLMKKWQGKIRDGFCETREMSFGGNGDLRVRTLAQLPALAEDFSGIVRSLETELSFTVPAGATSASDAVELPDHKLSFSNPVTVNVQVGKGVTGAITLITAQELDEASMFTLGTVSGRASAKYCSLKRTATGLVLEVSRPGLVIVVQ